MGNANPKLHTVRRGLTLPINGAPADGKEILTPPTPTSLAIVAADYPGLKPSLKVKVGDAVKRGQPLLEDRRNPGVPIVSPGAGVVAAIHRGERRALQSVVIALDAADTAEDNELSYAAWREGGLAEMNAGALRELLVQSGLWTALRTRPFGRIPDPASQPHAVFVTAMDTQPLAPAVADVLAGQASQLRLGLEALVKMLGDVPVHFCRADGAPVDAVEDVAGIQVHAFSGPHPAGNVGLHMHRIAPVSRTHVAWHIGCQDVAAIGHLVATGKLCLARVISLAGPAVTHPALYRVRMGCDVDGLVTDALKPGAAALISGSVLSGRRAQGEILGYLGRYHNQVTALSDEAPRRFLGWLSPGWNAFSVTNLFVSKLRLGHRFSLNTDRNGGHRTLVPFGSYDKVNAFDLMPVLLLRALIAQDLESAEALGCLELDEEDLALFTFVCPSKNEYGPALREVLNTIEREG